MVLVTQGERGGGVVTDRCYWSRAEGVHTGAARKMTRAGEVVVLSRCEADALLKAYQICGFCSDGLAVCSDGGRYLALHNRCNRNNKQQHLRPTRMNAVKSKYIYRSYQYLLFVSF